MLAKRHTIKMLLVILVIFYAPFSMSDRGGLPIAKDLQALGQKAAEQNIPIAILFAAEGLKSTTNIKEEAILPALYSGQLDGYVLMREINVNTADSTIDFYGEAIDNSEFKALYNLTTLPVVVFVNSDGNVIEEQLISGAYDYYFHYLKSSINRALSALSTLNNPNQIP